MFWLGLGIGIICGVLGLFGVMLLFWINNYPGPPPYQPRASSYPCAYRRDDDDDGYPD